MDGRFPYFYLGEGADLRIPGSIAWTGLVSTWSGGLKLRTPAGARSCAVAVEVHRDRPPDRIADYHDVVECGYRSAIGCPALLDWSRVALARLSPLPSGPGDYRLRYHLREARAVPGGGRAAALIQFWSAELGEPEELKISGRPGFFWHPAGTLRRSLEF